jgi:uncharacterized repeat protein (TIGR01451 family)
MRSKVFFLSLFLCCSFWAFAQDNPVAVRLEIYVVNVVDGQEELKEATQARPGQMVEYRLFATNTGDTTLPAGTVVITGPIPEGTAFVADSATPSSDSLLTEYSVDGTAFYEPPILVGADGQRTVAKPTDYKAVRWTLLENMAPGDEVTFAYRVTVNKS